MRESNVEDLLAKRAITEVIVLYARAIDRLDEDLLRSVFHPDSQHWHFFQGPSSAPGEPSTAESPADFVAFALGLLQTNYSRTHHQLGNISIDMDGATAARAETYFTAFHRMRSKSDPLAPADAFDTEMDYFVGGRYIDRFESRDGDWRIVNRTGITDWTRLEAVAYQGFSDIAPETIGQRMPDDFWYRQSE